MKKKFLTSLTICGLVVAAATGVQAARQIGSYDTNVPVIADFESGSLKKDNTSSAVNNVEKVDGGLVSWIENSSGGNITTKVSYSTPSRYLLDYSSASSYVGKSVHLNISTQTNVWNSVSTKGTWSPDER
ncbi:hypothetical protein [Thermaerobacillus caldiproteolyticus]|uniref:hypothetical protein n=1 Tax=Thermaerobacillus caldiproteolyticus TaxID=247480 RepID=UPI0018F1C8BB|nr:hypothetical protein [Anoxybacillus caldiproteolyticus]